MGMSLAHGGHLTHGSPVNISGKYFNFVPYGLDEETGRLNYDNILALAKENKPKMIVAGASAYPRAIDFEKLLAIAKEVGAYLMVDMAHIAGLVAGGQHMSPVPYADVVTTTTHKTLRGPRGGLILTNDEELAKKINKAIFPGIQGGPLMHVIAAKAVCFGEALKPEFTEYAKQIVKNASVLADSLLEKGFNLVSGGTDNHLMLVDLQPFNITGKELEKKLDEVYITVNKNAIPNDPQSPFVTSGVRIGTPAVTTRGMREAENIQEIESLQDIDMLGFIFYPKSPRYVYELPAYLPIHTHRVGVFVNEDKQIVSMYADRFGLNYVQLHGNESPEYCRSLYSMGIKIIKAFSISHPKDLKNVYKYEKVCDLFLFDTKCEQYGGSGNLFDWNILHTYNGLLPFLLSGGINSYSANALKEFKHPRLAGYDLNSRFELEPGKKDPVRIRTFLNELK